jgi:hypothetical protein
MRNNNIVHEFGKKLREEQNIKSRQKINIFVCQHFMNILQEGETQFLREEESYKCPKVLKLWSDDFDSNKSIKSNQQSVWIKTMTFFAMSSSGKKIIVTYPLTLSLKGLDHDVVEESFLKEINILRSGKPQVMFSRSHNSMVKVHTDTFCVLNNQPKRRSNLKLANGNSILHGRFGYIIDVRQVQDSIKSCGSCSRSIIMESTTFTVQREVKKE